MGLADLRERHAILAPVHEQAGDAGVELEQLAAEAAASVDRTLRLDLHLAAAGEREVLLAREQPVEPGRRDLEPVGHRDRVGRVTPGDIQRVSKEFLMPDKLSIVLVGDASAFANQLKAAGFPDFERIPLSQLDLNSPTFKRAAPAPGGGDPTRTGK